MIIIIVNNYLSLCIFISFLSKGITMSLVISRHLNFRENRLPTLQSQHLFALTKEVRIEHEGEEYRLRLTRNNRLILTK